MAVKVLELNAQQQMESVRYELHVVIKAFDGTLQAINWPTVFRQYEDARERAIRLMTTIVPDPDFGFEQISVEQISEKCFITKGSGEEEEE